MKITLQIDTIALQKRIAAMDFENNCKALLRDATNYLAERIKLNIISGQYVGVRTGNLRANTKGVMQSDTSAYVFSAMPYTTFVLAWSKNKYGSSYSEVAFRLYAAVLQDTAKKEIFRICQAQSYKYQNPF